MVTSSLNIIHKLNEIYDKVCPIIHAHSFIIYCHPQTYNKYKLCKTQPHDLAILAPSFLFLYIPEIPRPHPFPTHVTPYIIHYSKKPVATLPHSVPLKMTPDGLWWVIDVYTWQTDIHPTCTMATITNLELMLTHLIYNLHKKTWLHIYTW